MLKSIAIVIGCYALSVVLVLCSDPLLSAVFPGDFARGHIPSDKALVASTACFVVVALLCAWLCTRYAPARKGRHVLAFMLLGEAMGVVATIPNWNTGWPHWYWLSWLVAWPVCCLLGYRLGARNVTVS